MNTPEQSRLPRSIVRQRLLLLVLVACIFALVAFPFFVVRPFARQDPFYLAIALVTQRWAPWITLMALPAGLWMAYNAWAQRGERFRTFKGLAMVAAVFLLMALALIARINIFERMFHPLAGVKLIPAARAGARGNDMVMAVRMNGEARAYPVLQMAYHHIVNDTLGGVPIVVTY